VNGLSKFRSASILIVPLLVLSACGGGGADNDATSDPDNAATAEVDPADQNIADESLLVLKDFPPGWEAADAEQEDGTSRQQKEKIAECVGVDYGELYDFGAKALSQNFTSEYDETVSSKVPVAADEATMKRAFEIGASAEFRKCSAEGVSDVAAANLKESGQNAKIGKVTVNEMSFDSFGDEINAFRVTVPIAVQGLEVEATADIIQVRVGRASVVIQSNGVGNSLTSSELSEYVEKAVERLTQALEAAA